MHILVTGGAGFIGSHLTDALLQNGHRVTVLDNLSASTTEYIAPKAEFIKADIRDESILSVFESHHFDVVYHEAAQTLVPASVSDPQYDADENIMGLLRILEAARLTKVKKIIFSSSAAVYGDNPRLPLSETEPLKAESFYGLTKQTAEQYLALYRRFYGLRYTVLRYSNVYGPRQGAHGEGGVVYIFAKALAKNRHITIFGDGGQTRDFISVRDVISANLAALSKGDDDIFNISTGVAVSLRGLSEKMLAISGKDDSLLRYGPVREGDIYHSSLSPAKAKDRLLWEPTQKLDDGLRETLDFFRS